jgi:hypothetical protein
MQNNFTSRMMACGAKLILFLLSAAGVTDRNLRAEGENLILVVNSSSADSLAVANHYIELRNIPPLNVIYIDSFKILPNLDGESAHVKYFESQVLNPVLEAIEKRGLRSQIQYIVYSAGFPTRVTCQPQVGKFLKATNQKYDIHFHAPWVSLTSATFFHENIFSDAPDFVRLDANHYATNRTDDLFKNPFVGDSRTEFDLGITALQQGDYPTSISKFDSLVAENPRQPIVRFFLAKALSSAGKLEKANQQLQVCKKLGWSYPEAISADAAFSPLKSTREFDILLDEMESNPPSVRGSRSFSSGEFWASNGWPNGSAEQGQRYVLSTMLAVTGENASSLDQAFQQLESSVQADGSNPQGTFFFADHENIRSKIRKNTFQAAADQLIKMGFDVDISDSTAPKNKQNILGATLGSPVVDWKSTNSKFVPGALCDNFTSYGGWWAKASQTQLSDFLNAGAAGASGTVYEPYTIPAKFPGADLHVHYAKGFSLAEAFYQSVPCPFQLLIVGDPLCRPFGQFPSFDVDGLLDRTVVKSNFEIQFTNTDSDRPIRHFEIFLDGKLTGKTDGESPFQFELSKLSEGYHDLRVVAVANSSAAATTSKQLEFFVRTKGDHVKLVLNKKTTNLGQPITIEAIASDNQTVKILHNSRVVANIKSGSSGEIDSSLLGQGHSKLYGVIQVNGKAIASVPMSIHVLPHSDE